MMMVVVVRFAFVDTASRWVKCNLIKIRAKSKHVNKHSQRGNEIM